MPSTCRRRAHRSFREALLKEAGEAFPEDAAAYRQLAVDPGRVSAPDAPGAAGPDPTAATTAAAAAAQAAAPAAAADAQ